MEYSVKLETFEGPFELLFFLIRQAEVDIYDIPISEITDQYLDYLSEMKTKDLNITSEFILMAATLIEIKSKMLLPSSKKDDPRIILIDQLLEYKKCKEASEMLKSFEEEACFYIGKNKEEFVPDKDSKNEQLCINTINISELYNTFLKLIKENDIEETLMLNRRKFVYRESYRVTDCIEEIMIELKNSTLLSINKLLKDRIDRSNLKEYVVTVFLAILELSKNTKVTIEQDRNFGDIKIYKLESVNE